MHGTKHYHFEILECLQLKQESAYFAYKKQKTIVC